MAGARAAEIVRRRRPEWEACRLRWRWLRESYEGGDTYRRASYGTDQAGYPLRNLVRHKHEVPTSGVVPDRSGVGEDRNYWMRLERTPVPSMMAEAIESHLSEIYQREIGRNAEEAPGIAAWWTDVDGSGTEIADWMVDAVAPYLLALGCLDLLFDRPRVPDGESVATKADQVRLNLDRCVASIVLPECVVWWDDDPITGRYREALVLSEDHGKKTYRLWTSTGSTLFDERGETIEEVPHAFGRCPLVRVFDRRRPLAKYAGIPRYEAIAELQREAYNRESELVLTGAILSHPTIQAPEEFIGENAEIPIGPGFILPKKKVIGGAGQATYEGWEYVDPPSTGAESNRADLERIRDQVDRAAKLTKPAGASGTGKGTVSQSGVSKALDQKSGNALLGRVAAALEKVERIAVEFVGAILGESGAAVEISYPRSFNLLASEELAAVVIEIQSIVAASGDVPTLESAAVQALARQALPGIDADEMDAIHQEIDDAIRAKAASRDREEEAIAAGTLRITNGSEPGSAGDSAGTDFAAGIGGE